MLSRPDAGKGRSMKKSQFSEAQVATDLRAAYRVSERRLCRAFVFARATQRYQSRRPPCAELRARLHTLAELKPRWGYRRLHWLP